MNCDFNFKILIIFLITSFLQLRVFNAKKEGVNDTGIFGCGPGRLTIDDKLKRVGEGDLIECCIEHDVCYGQCLVNQTECDDQFDSCLKIKCKKFKNFIRNVFCQIDSLNMVKLVRKFGFLSFCIKK